MAEREAIHQRARSFFEELWSQGDHWEFESSGFERARCQRLMELLSDRRYANVLELGCGSGYFTRLLAGVSDRIVAIDISQSAIERARAAGAGPAAVDYRVANIMEYDPRGDGPWDLIVLSDTVYYLGWLYPFFDIAWLASELFGTTRPCGRLLLANTESGVEDELLRPWMTRTYRDLFRNVGYRLDREEIFHGTKNDVAIGILVSLFEKSANSQVAS